MSKGPKSVAERKRDSRRRAQAVSTSSNNKKNKKRRQTRATSNDSPNNKKNKKRRQTRATSNDTSNNNESNQVNEINQSSDDQDALAASEDPQGRSCVQNEGRPTHTDEYCHNCMRQNFEDVPKSLEIVFHRVGSRCIRNTQSHLRIVKQTSDNEPSTFYTLCTECKKFLDKSECTLTLKETRSWENTWPSFFWNMLSGKDSRDEKWFSDVYTAVELWRFVPESIREFWKESLTTCRQVAFTVETHTRDYDSGRRRNKRYARRNDLGEFDVTGLEDTGLRYWYSVNSCIDPRKFNFVKASLIWRDSIFKIETHTNDYDGKAPRRYYESSVSDTIGLDENFIKFDPTTLDENGIELFKTGLRYWYSSQDPDYLQTNQYRYVVPDERGDSELNVFDGMDLSSYFRDRTSDLTSFRRDIKKNGFEATPEAIEMSIN